MDIISWIKTTLSKYSSNNTHDKNAIYFVKNEDGKTGKIISDEIVYGNGGDANGVVVESPKQPTGGESVWVNPDEDPEEVAVYNRSQVDALHQSIVNSITSLSEAGYLFSGIATFETDPGTPDAKVFYIANGKGTYEKFGGIEVTEDEVVVLKYDTAWHKVATGIASDEKLSELESEVFENNTPIVEWVNGFVIDNLLIKSTSAGDKVSKPIFVKSGKTIRFSTEGDGNFFFTTIAYATSDTSIIAGSTLQSRIAYRATGRNLESYTFTAESDCYIVLCGRELDTTSVSFEGYKSSKIERIEESIVGIEPINKEYDLSAFDTIAFIDVNNWKVNNLINYNGIAIPVVYGQMFVFVGGENNTDYAFVKSIGTSAVPVDFATLKSKVSLKANETRVVAVPSDAKYLYITKTNAGIDKLPVSVFSTFSTAELGNPLFGKQLAVNGDSICYGAGYYGGYAKIISENNCMGVQNIGIGGGTIAADTYADSGEARHWICRTMQNLDNDADYYIIEGGVNDASINVPLGSLSSALNSSIDDKTFYGAMESICRYLMLNCQGKKVGFIIVHQMTAGMQPNGDYYNAIITCLTKYGIPYLDLSKQVPPFGIAGFDASMRTTYTYNGDGWHPNEEGYKKYYVPKIEAWMRTL